jgi:hypothetical protein
MSFDLTQLMDSSDMKAEYVCTAHMFDVSDTTMGLLLAEMGTDMAIPEAAAIAVATSPLDEARMRVKAQRRKEETRARTQVQRERDLKQRAELGLGPTDQEKKRMAGQLKSGYRPEGE